MKEKHSKHDPGHRHGDMAVPAAAVPLTAEETGFAVSPLEVSRRAYFTYLNEGARPGRDVQHWLDAEARMLAERKLTREHGCHNPT